MSEQCKMRSLPLEVLKPQWVEFTDTKGVLRILRPQEAPDKAAGMVFKCPRCRHDKQKEHYCIFLFPNAPEKARPHGRFILDLADHKGRYKVPLGKQSLYMLNLAGGGQMLLKPGDLKCGWEGFLVEGKISWRPNFMERLRAL